MNVIIIYNSKERELRIIGGDTHGITITMEDTHGITMDERTDLKSHLDEFEGWLAAR
jgi:hypothetical protein